jgi:hypothetical protein
MAKSKASERVCKIEEYRAIWDWLRRLMDATDEEKGRMRFVTPFTDGVAVGLFEKDDDEPEMGARKDSAHHAVRVPVNPARLTTMFFLPVSAMYAEMDQEEGDTELYQALHDFRTRQRSGRLVRLLDVFICIKDEAAVQEEATKKCRQIAANFGELLQGEGFDGLEKALTCVHELERKVGYLGELRRSAALKSLVQRAEAKAWKV